MKNSSEELLRKQDDRRFQTMTLKNQKCLRTMKANCQKMIGDVRKCMGNMSGSFKDVVNGRSFPPLSSYVRQIRYYVMLCSHAP